MIKNWQHLCIFGRLASNDVHIDGKTIYHDDKRINIVDNNGITIDYLDAETGEILLTQGEDGFPIYLSDWAKQEPSTPYQIA